MQALILAAGQGTRLGPIGELIPKPLLYLPGGSLLEYQM
jgi:choline kinase